MAVCVCSCSATPGVGGGGRVYWPGICWIQLFAFLLMVSLRVAPPPYPVKLVFTCKQHESCKRKPVQRARQETEKLEFCVAEGSWSSSRQIFLLRTRSKGKWRPIQKPLKLMARTSCLLHSILTTNQKKIWRQLKWLRPRIDAKLLPKIK